MCSPESIVHYVKWFYYSFIPIFKINLLSLYSHSCFLLFFSKPTILCITQLFIPQTFTVSGLIVTVVHSNSLVIVLLYFDCYNFFILKWCGIKSCFPLEWLVFRFMCHFQVLGNCRNLNCKQGIRNFDLGGGIFYHVTSVSIRNWFFHSDLTFFSSSTIFLFDEALSTHIIHFWLLFTFILIFILNMIQNR